MIATDPARWRARDAERLLDFQLWCLGQDIHHPAGNLLRVHGAERTREPGPDGPTRYTVWLPDGDALVLWGFGVGVLGASRALVLPRHPWAPTLAPRARLEAPVPRANCLPRGPRPVAGAEPGVAASLLAAAAAWMAQYDRAVLAAVGPAWRAACAARRPRRLRRQLPCAPTALASQWEAAAAAATTLLGAAPAARRVRVTGR